ESTLTTAIPTLNERQQQRYDHHNDFVRRYETERGSRPGYTNLPHNVPVMTKQETDLELLMVDRIERTAPCIYHAAHRRLEPGGGVIHTVGIPSAPAGEINPSVIGE
ncbi:MAG TPA: hypothetical protein VJ932_10830, partial [Alkalispirochaeta sp.]|nr:hypothetical protein [Alkalispirochaeta sp.]